MMRWISCRSPESSASTFHEQSKSREMDGSSFEFRWTKTTPLSLPTLSAFRSRTSKRQTVIHSTTDSFPSNENPLHRCIRSKGLLPDLRVQGKHIIENWRDQSLPRKRFL